ncbi:MAG TPA: hypothetical protein VIF14_06370 [Alphaproteobacteria bacterium]|jgi:hypothetical protein
MPLLGVALSIALGATIAPAVADEACIAGPNPVCIADMAVAASKADDDVRPFAVLAAALARARTGRTDDARRARDQIALMMLDEKLGFAGRARWAELLARTGGPGPSGCDIRPPRRRAPDARTRARGQSGHLP